MKKKFFLLFTILLAFPQFFFCQNDWKKSYLQQPVIHIHNNVSTGGSSIVSAFKYFSLMVIAWEGGARFVGYSDFGFINKVLKPVFNWLQKQTGSSVERFIIYLRAKDDVTISLFVNWILEPLRQKFFKNTVPVEIIQSARRETVPLRGGAPVKLQGMNFDRVTTGISDQNDNNQYVIESTRVDDLKFDLNDDQSKRELVTVVNTKVDETPSDINDQERIKDSATTQAIKPQMLSLHVNAVSDYNNQKQQQKVIVKPKAYVPFSSRFSHSHIPHVADLAKKKIKKEELFKLVEEFLKIEWQTGDDKKKELIKNFYAPDSQQFPQFYKLNAKFKDHLRVTFFLYAKSIYCNPMPLLSSHKGYTRGFGHHDIPRFYDQGTEILESMSKLYHLFEKNPQECLEMIGITPVCRGARL